MTSVNDISTTAQVPTHVAIIMDGNGRWARQRGLDRSKGHEEGVNSVRAVVEAANEAGVKYLTLYTFSTENWNRPQAEVDALMHLLALAIEAETPELAAKNVRLNLIGNIDRLPDYTRNSLNNSITRTAESTGLVLTLAISYSARWEITEAVRSLVADARTGLLGPDDITDEMVASRLSTAGMPDPDLLIRTGGDLRVSNYLLWQIAYSEIIVTPTLWPDFRKDEFVRALQQYGGRERRFGLTSEQLVDGKVNHNKPQ